MGYPELLRFLEELDGALTSLTALQDEKRAAAQDLDGLNACMKREQALSLALRGLERRREPLLASLGLAGTALRDLPQRCPPEHRGETARAVEKVLRSYQVLQSAQGAARTVLEGRLRQVEGELERRGLDPEEPPLPPGARRSGQGHTDWKV